MRSLPVCFHPGGCAGYPWRAEGHDLLFNWFKMPANDISYTSQDQSTLRAVASFQSLKEISRGRPAGGTC